MFCNEPMIDLAPATIDRVELPEFTERGIRVDTLRLDKIHPVISGNKWFKLKEHLRIAMEKKNSGIVTFGGAWSNHIAAAAYAAKKMGLQATGIIRGESAGPLSTTLRAATGYGMRLAFISRGEYRKKGDTDFLDKLSGTYPGAYILPEGGAGPAGIKGSEDIAQLAGKNTYSHLVCAIGTGTMFMGLARACPPRQKLIGIPVLKGLDPFPALSSVYTDDPGGSARSDDPERSARSDDPERSARCQIDAHYHFGGYARKTEDLLLFMRRLYASTGVPTDFVYTGKLFYAVLDRAKKGLFPPGSEILVIHSGGLQGNQSLPPGTLNY